MLETVTIFPIKLLDLVHGATLHVRTGCSSADPQREEFIDFAEREAQFLGSLDEANSRNGLLRVLAETGGLLCGTGIRPRRW